MYARGYKLKDCDTCRFLEVSTKKEPCLSCKNFENYKGLGKFTVYISGQITDNPNFQDDFAKGVCKLREMGFKKIINPCCLSVLNLDYEQYMKICFAMIDVADYVYFLDNWDKSAGATRELKYAESKQKIIKYEY